MCGDGCKTNITEGIRVISKQSIIRFHRRNPRYLSIIIGNKSLKLGCGVSEEKIKAEATTESVDTSREVLGNG